MLSEEIYILATFLISLMSISLSLHTFSFYSLNSCFKKPLAQFQVSKIESVFINGPYKCSIESKAMEL